MAKEHTLISNSATVGVLLTLTDNSNYFSECAFRSLPNVSWQIIKKTSGLFDTATKYKSVFLAAIKGGASFVQVKCFCTGGKKTKKTTKIIMYVHVPPVAGKSWIKTGWVRREAVEYSEWQLA